jgi:hypothetical protein
VDGQAYVGQMEQRHLREQKSRSTPADLTKTIGVNGFPVTSSLRREIRALDLRAWRPARPLRVDLAVSSQRELWEALRGPVEGTGGLYALSPSAGDWEEVDAFGSALIPQSIIQTIVGFVKEGGR